MGRARGGSGDVEKEVECFPVSHFQTGTLSVLLADATPLLEEQFLPGTVSEEAAGTV